MQIDDKLLSHLEKLSHLHVAPEKRQEIEEQLSEIVGFVDNLSELDTDHVEATFSTVDAGARLREDETRSSAEVTAAILDNAPVSQDGFFIVPKIIE